MLTACALVGCSMLAATASLQVDQTPTPEGAGVSVVEVLETNRRLNAAALAGDAAVLAEILADDLVVTDPGNRIRRREDLIELFAGGAVEYRSLEVQIDFADEVGELVVLMGTEKTVVESVPEGAPWKPGDVLYRRFTNVYRREDGAWRLAVKQSTPLPPPAAPPAPPS